VMTGAPLPQGADRVVMVERSRVVGDGVYLEPHDGERSHVRRRGEDFAVGSVVVPRGTLLGPGALVAAAAADVGEVRVWRRPRVRLLATGDEIAAPGTATALPHTIPDSLSIALAAVARNWGAEIVATDRATDDSAAIRAAARRALSDVDLLIIAGGASRGDRDQCRAALAAMGMDLAFADVAIKPGKPVWFGRLGRLAVLGLPGNPTAALTVARLFLAPLLAGLGGRQPNDVMCWETRPLAAPVAANGDREAFLCGVPTQGAVGLLERQSASGQAILAQARYLLRRPAHAPMLGAGARVPVLAF
ncbi:MAG TPA: molybdopterin-binding protein, partial [Sphingomonas sp.]|nr:molybdopterin-binding protein [Sphingomonas sp.]